MKPRKNPKHDLERKRGLFLSIGLCISMGLTLTAFEYAVPVSVDDSYEPPVDVFEDVDQCSPNETQSSPTTKEETNRDSACGSGDYRCGCSRC